MRKEGNRKKESLCSLPLWPENKADCSRIILSAEFPGPKYECFTRPNTPNFKNRLSGFYLNVCKPIDQGLQNGFLTMFYDEKCKHAE